jgi:hypothetical protein
MKYLCLVYHEAPHPEMPTQPPDPALAAEARAFDDDLRQRGHLLDTHTLEVASAATTIRIRESRLLVDTSPCAPAPDRLDGYYLIEARDLNDAIRLIARNPSARHGRIEVHPVKPA